MPHDEKRDGGPGQAPRECSDEALLAPVERALGAPVPAQLRAGVLAAARDGQQHGNDARAFALSEGSEPAFVFRPTPGPERHGG